MAGLSSVTPARARECMCGAVLPRGKQYCETCRVQKARHQRFLYRSSAQHQADKAMAKALRRSRARVGAESFSPNEVFDRDGWVCQICRVDTPPTLRGTIDEQAPELDHIVPLALGGRHTRSNVRCLCRGCNNRKGSKHPDDPRLRFLAPNDEKDSH